MIQPKKQINNIYGYTRVSSDQQVKDGSSLDEQQKVIEQFVQAKFNRPVDKFFVDAGYSGMADLVDRPGSRELTDIMDRHDVIVVTKLDRIARSFIEMVNMIPTLEETGITLYFCEMFGDTPVVLPRDQESKGLEAKLDMNRINNRNLVSQLAQFAEFEREMLKQRFASGKIAWAEKGYGIGGHVPFGYTKEYDNSGSRRRTKLVPVPAEQEVLKFIKAAREQGLGARRIATQIQNRFPGFEDFPYHKVHRIIKRKFQGLHE
jgi:DNA invertase Pin-like site-specific DNA recombinase